MASSLTNFAWSTEHLQSTSDADLVKRAQITRRTETAARAQAIGELYDRYHEDVFRYIWARVSNQQVAEDLTGEVFIRMVTNLNKYRPSGAPFVSWLYRIARNLIIDDHRKAANRYEVFPIERAGHISREEKSITVMVEDRLFIEQVQNALQKLKPLKQDVLILRFIVGLPLKEVADILGKTTGSIKVTQHRALKELRIILETTSGEEI